MGSLSHVAAASLRNRSIGFIFQTFNLLPVYTVYENVEFPLLLLRVPSARRKAMVMEALEMVGLADRARSRPHQLSGGQSQRVAVCRAIVKKPEIVLADEPTANLDAANSHGILQTMQRLNRDLGTTFLFSTHDDKVIRYLERKIVLVDGRVERDERTGGTPMILPRLAFRNCSGPDSAPGSMCWCCRSPSSRSSPPRAFSRG